MKVSLGLLVLLGPAGISRAQNEGDLRLVGGSTLVEGRLEVFHAGQWGTVCDDGFNNVNATVACNQMEFGTSGVAAPYQTFPAGVDPIWMDNVACSGTETQLISCPFSGFGIHNCSHSEDVGIICSGCDPANGDADNDGVGDICDNCPSISNTGQQDCDHDGVGDACDTEPDSNGNGIADACEPCLVGPCTQSRMIAMVPNPGGRYGYGGDLPTSGFPVGVNFSFMNVDPLTIGATEDLAGFDTVVLVGICDIGSPEFLGNAAWKSTIESFVARGGKLIVWDSECQNTDYSNFVLPFSTNNPGQLGAQGTLGITEENSLSRSIPSSNRFIDVDLVGNQTDAVGDANVFLSFDERWCVDMKAINASIGAPARPTHTYAGSSVLPGAGLGNGLIIYNGLDKDVMMNGQGFGVGSGLENLARIWLFELLQPFNPDALPCDYRTTCGNGQLDPNEECDQTAASTGCTAPDQCDVDDCVCVTPPHCGDGYINPPELCDPSAVPTQCGGATPVCDDVVCECFPAPVCGDNVRDPGETCDGTDDAACPGACPPPGQPLECHCPICGDDVVNQQSEQCDGIDSANCPAGCNPSGGPGECQCVSASTTTTTTTTLPITGACCTAAGCSVTTPSQCQAGTYQGDGTDCNTPGICPACGNGLVETGEKCDDANTAAGDGCDASCEVEQCWICVADVVPTTTVPTLPGPSVCSHDDGASCDDGDICTVGDTCGGGNCDGEAVVIPAACRWVMVGDTKVQSRTRGQSAVTGHVCGGRVRIGEFATANGDAVATLASGVGIQIGSHAAVSGDIVTGGSAVRGKPRLVQLPGLATDVVAGGTTAVQSGDPTAIYDTLGTNARVGDCSDAQGDVAAGDLLLTTLPPGPDLGDTFIPQSGALTLTATNPGALNVFDFARLRSLRDATLTLDGAGNAGSVFVLRVQRKLDLRLRSKIVLAGATVPGNVVLYSQGKCRFGEEVTGVGTVFCPNGKLILEERTQWQGALVGGRGRVELRDSGTLIHAPLQVAP